MEARRGFLSVALFVLLLALAFLPPSINAQEATDAEIEKMKISQLKKFLEERGAECFGCIEKSHYVQRAKEVRESPVISKTSSPASDEQSRKKTDENSNKASSDNNGDKTENKGSEQSTNKNTETGKKKKNNNNGDHIAMWKGIGKKVCEEEAAKLKPAVSPCAEFAQATEQTMQSLSTNLLQVMGTTPARFKQVSSEEPFKSAGTAKLRNTARSVIEKGVTDVHQISQLLHQSLSEWAMNTIAEKKEAMFTMPGMDINEILQRYMQSDQAQQAANKPRQRKEYKSKVADDADTIVLDGDDEGTKDDL